MRPRNSFTTVIHNGDTKTGEEFPKNPSWQIDLMECEVANGATIPTLGPDRGSLIKYY